MNSASTPSATSGSCRFSSALEQYGINPPAAQLHQSADPTIRRQQKVERYQQEKAAKARLAELQQTRLRRKRFKELEEAGADSDDAEGERESWLTRIELAALRVAEAILLLIQVVACAPKH